MSKRSNSFGLRLGSIQTWNFILTNYNKNFKQFLKLILEKKYIEHSMSVFLNQLNTHAIFSKICFYHNSLELTVNYVQLKFVKTQSFLQVINKTINNVNKIPITSKLKIFNKKNNFLISYFLSEYIKFCYNYNKNSLKTIFNKIEQDLQKIIKKKVYYSTTKGIKKGHVKGIKLLCKGRLGTMRNPLTQTFVKSLGNVPFLKLNDCVDYTKNLLFTKQGVYSLHVWIFYSNV